MVGEGKRNNKFCESELEIPQLEWPYYASFLAMVGESKKTTEYAPHVFSIHHILVLVRELNTYEFCKSELEIPQLWLLYLSFAPYLLNMTSKNHFHFDTYFIANSCHFFPSSKKFLFACEMCRSEPDFVLWKSDKAANKGSRTITIALS